MSSIRHIGGNRWQVSVYAGRDSDSRQRRLTRVFTATGPRDAKRKAARVEVELRKQIGSIDGSGRTVAWLLERWLEHKASLPNRSPNTLASNRRLVEVISNSIGKVRLDRLDPITIERFYGDLRKRKAVNGRTISESTVAHYHAALRGAIRQGHRWGFIDRSVIERVHAPSPRSRRVQIPQSDAVATVIAAAPKGFATLLRVYAATGARRSEILGLRWPDIHADHMVIERTVYEQPGKGVQVKQGLKRADEERRVVALDPSTVNLLADWRREVVQTIRDAGSRFGDNVFVFPDLRADASGRTPMRPNSVTQRFRDLCDQVGVSMRLHDLRHWHASRLIDAGLPITSVSERLGHSQVSTTINIYAHSDRARDRQAATLIGSILDGVPPQGLEP